LQQGKEHCAISKGISIWDDNGFNTVMARPLLPGASCCNRRFPDSIDQLDLLVSHSPPSFLPLSTAQSSVYSVSNCCDVLDPDCSGPLGCFDDPTRSCLGCEEEFNNWFIEGGLDTPVGLVFDVTAVLIVVVMASV